jgi:hypothetical protein
VPEAVVKPVASLDANREDLNRLRTRQPFLWINPGWQHASASLGSLPLGYGDLMDAEARLLRFAPPLQNLYPELRRTHGVIESALLPARALAERILPPQSGRLWVKADHALPVAGSVKARGGGLCRSPPADRERGGAGLPPRTRDIAAPAAGHAHRVDHRRPVRSSGTPRALPGNGRIVGHEEPGQGGKRSCLTQA